MSHKHHFMNDGLVWECVCGETRDKFGKFLSPELALLERHTGFDTNFRQIHRVELPETKP